MELSLNIFIGLISENGYVFTRADKVPTSITWHTALGCASVFYYFKWPSIFPHDCRS